ncbi:MAG: hydrogenase expression/formation protein HypE [Clostridiales Family XIII bacterium]|jgi:hydrogenase expression/formation protein HypE|nr:hydrogenase expression/formation protein HypE [Clostridiales Family XIII bacterium]
MNDLNTKITMAHGAGGMDSHVLMRDVFAEHFSNEVLNRMEDGAVLDLKSPQIAVSTDTFVVTPLVFSGGDIGKLAVCGSVNDVLMMGATPKYLTCGFVLETGLEIELLDQICGSMAKTAKEAGVIIVAGDTKVIEGSGGLFVNTTCIGMYPEQVRDSSTGPVTVTGPSAANIEAGDVIIVSGNLGDHHACILSARMNIQNDIKSDCAILAEIPSKVREAGIGIKAMRDVTRGGLATVLNELAASSGVSIELGETAIPVDASVRAFCGIMGLDPKYMGNEGKMVLVVSPEKAEETLEIVRSTGVGKDAAIIGVAKDATSVGAAQGKSSGKLPPVYMRTKIGGKVRVDMLYGEGLPRIC